jgi:HSP20 family protein
MFNLLNVLDDVMRTDPWFRPFLAGSAGDSSSSWPLVDVVEADAAYLIDAELPGVKLEDVKIEIDNNVLTLSAQKHAEDRPEHEYHRVERSYGTFRRSFVLPRGVQTDAVQATMKNGVLSIHLPKMEQARARRIPIQIAGSAAKPAQISAQASADTVATAAE